MYINAEDVKMYMDLDIHKQVADFLNKQIAETQKLINEFKEDIKNM